VQASGIRPRLAKLAASRPRGALDCAPLRRSTLKSIHWIDFPGFAAHMLSLWAVSPEHLIT
jgi:hypothetical protein